MTTFAGSLDTNVLLRLTLKDIPGQFERAKRLVAAPGARFLVSDTAIIEYVFALERHYALSRAQIEEMLTGLMTIPALECNDTLLLEAAALYIGHPKLSFEDCYLATSAQAFDATPLWSFDKKLVKQTKLTQEPD
ncbi:MAG: PIN domain-containing protein [Actinomycetes bacterium]|jgi:predicted nucleic acid-binding protein|nr:PIN domain-containing protein [Actinomycetes bacterium]